jgi:hypothetical protein
VDRRCARRARAPAPRLTAAAAEEALTAALPEGWTEHTDASGNSFYFNASTGSSTWEHPLDEYYRSLFLKLKKILVENRAAGKVNQSSTLLQCAYRQHAARTAFRIRLGLYRLGQSANVVQAVLHHYCPSLPILNTKHTCRNAPERCTAATSCATAYASSACASGSSWRRSAAALYRPRSAATACAARSPTCARAGPSSSASGRSCSCR